MFFHFPILGLKKSYLYYHILSTLWSTGPRHALSWHDNFYTFSISIRSSSVLGFCFYWHSISLSLNLVLPRTSDRLVCTLELSFLINSQDTLDSLISHATCSHLFCVTYSIILVSSLRVRPCLLPLP